MENLDKWRQAGSIAAEALAYGKDLIKPGIKLLDVSDKVDAKIIELGGLPAFPTQISCDHIAAHYCAEPDDPIVFDKQLACLDVGVHVDGCIGDNACTVDLSGDYAELVKASREALNNAIKTIQIGTTLGEVGRIVNETIQSFGFVPIRNLSGHGLGVYNIHSKPTIPNFDTGDKTEFTKGQIVAIEPFATNGRGMIYEVDKGNIFSMVERKPVRSPITRTVLKEIDKFNNLPFTTRWLTKSLPLFKVKFALRELLQVGVIRSYPALPDKNKGMVSQAEHTLLIDDNVEILTKI